MEERVAPLSAEYTMNSMVAVEACMRWMRALIMNTIANWAMIRPKKTSCEPKMTSVTPGLLATP